MTTFHLTQFEHESFLQYLSRLNGSHSQYVHFMYPKWKIYNIAPEGIISETQAILKSTCYSDLCPLHVDDMWNFFES